MAFSHRMGRKAKKYPATWDDLSAVVMYDFNTGDIETVGPYGSKGTVMKDGHLHLKVPITEGVMERGRRRSEYFRADHIAWMLVTGQWPDGWMEHINGIRTDCALDNLVYCDINGERWWYGEQVPGERAIVKVDADGGLDAVGPVTLRVIVNGQVVVRPQVSEGYRKGEPPVLADKEPEVEPVIEWGVGHVEQASSEVDT